MTVNGAVGLISPSHAACRQPDGAGGAAGQRLVAESPRRFLAAARAAGCGGENADAGVPLPLRERQSPHDGGVSGGGFACDAVSGVSSCCNAQCVREGGAGGAADASGDGSPALRFHRAVLHAAREARAGAGVERPAGDDLSGDGGDDESVRRSCGSCRANCWSRS